MEVKKCNTCLEEKSVNDFYTQKKYSKKRGNWIYTHPECKECAKIRSTAWRKKESNRESWLNSQKKRNKSFVSEIRDASKRQKEDGYYRMWQQNNKDKTSNYNSNRVMNKTHEITEEEWEICKRFFGNVCAYCGISENEAVAKYKQKLHKEHVDHNGSNTIDNCVPSCKGCNSKKFTFTLDEWYIEGNPIYSKDRYDRIAYWLNNCNTIITE